MFIDFFSLIYRALRSRSVWFFFSKKQWLSFLKQTVQLSQIALFSDFSLLWIVYFVDTPGSRMENHLIGDTMMIESLNNLVEELWWLNLPETKMSVSIPFHFHEKISWNWFHEKKFKLPTSFCIDIFSKIVCNFTKKKVVNIIMYKIEM